VHLLRAGSLRPVRASLISIACIALADPTRRAIVVRLPEGEASVRVRRCRLVADPMRLADDWLSTHRVFWERGERRRA
jgi:hypothetical protein